MTHQIKPPRCDLTHAVVDMEDAMMTYHLNIGGQTWDAFDAPDDASALATAQQLLDAGPHGDPSDGPAEIVAGVFDPDDRHIGDVSVAVA